MAFAFFRRRRKLVIFVMVFLMVTFLLTLGGGGDEIKGVIDSITRLFGARDPNLVGESSLGKLYRNDLISARQDMEILGSQSFDSYIGSPSILAALAKTSSDKSESASNGWMLLLQEAQKAGMVMSPEETRAQLLAGTKARGRSEGDYDKLVTDLRSAQSSVSEKALLQAVSHWMAIEQYFRVQMPAGPGLLAEQKALFRDLSEQTNLRVVVLRPEPLLASASLPSDADIEALFNQYKDKVAGQATTGESFDFGYRLGDRVRVRTLTINAEAIRRVSVPEKTEIASYYLNHPEEFAPAPSTAPAASAPASRPAKIDFFTARPRIIETLRPQVARGRVDELVSRLNREAKAAQAANVKDPLAKVYADQLVDPTANQALLAKQLPAEAVNAVNGLSIDAAMAALAQAAGIADICFPWSSFGQTRVAPDVRVTLSCPAGQTMTLAAALDEVAQLVLPKQAGSTTQPAVAPKLTWVAVKGVGDPKAADGRVLYCISSNAGVDLFPFHLGDTGLVERAELIENPILADCRTGRDEGDSLAAKAFALVGRETKDLPASEIKPIGKEMYVVHPSADDTDLVDRVIWQALETAKNQPPDTMTPRIRKQVITDWQTKMLFESQLTPLAAKLVEEAKTAGLAEAAKKLSAPAAWETGLFTRLTYEAASANRIDVVPLSVRIMQMTPEYLEMACKAAAAGEMRYLLPLLQRTQREILSGQVRDLAQSVQDSVLAQVSGAEDGAGLLQQLRSALSGLNSGDYRPLFRLANTPMPNGKRIAAEQVQAIRGFLFPVEMAVNAAKTGNLDLLSLALSPDAKPMYLLGKLHYGDAIKKFLTEAFRAPADIEAPLAELDKPGPAVTLAVPGARVIVVFQRIGWRPPVSSDFYSVGQGEKLDRNKVAGCLANQRVSAGWTWWFNNANVIQRLGYKAD
ncbi:MAG: hypothetical protein NTV86_17560 [Planctomycetota bacterium]|nr:hypothetical protein [Planctomycetota bacterium]